MQTPTRRVTRSSAGPATPLSLGKRARKSEAPTRCLRRKKENIPPTECEEASLSDEEADEPQDAREVEALVLPPTPAATPKRSLNAQARSLLRLSSQSKSKDQSLPLLGRDRQREEILAFLNARTDTSTAESSANGALYISGRPGSGKTALISEIIEGCDASINVLSLNCTTIQSRDLCGLVLSAMGGEVEGRIIKSELASFAASAQARST